MRDRSDERPMTGWIPSSRHCPARRFTKMVDALADELREQEILVLIHCRRSEHKGPWAGRLLSRKLGPEMRCAVRLIRGGYSAWTAEALPTRGNANIQGEPPEQDQQEESDEEGTPNVGSLPEAWVQRTLTGRMRTAGITRRRLAMQLAVNAEAREAQKKEHEERTRGKPVCRDFKKGTCKYGTRCHYSHRRA